MNQSNCNKLAGILFIVGIIILILIQPNNTWPHYTDDCLDYDKIEKGEEVHYTACDWDAIYVYGPIIAGKKSVTDWHSSLYMYECKALQTIAATFSLPADGICAQIVLYYIYFIITLSFACHFIYQLIKNNIISALLFIPVCISVVIALRWMPLVLDYFFCCHFIVLCILLWYLLRANKRAYKIIGWILVGVCIFHMANFRKNAICIIPFICYIFFRCNGIFAKKIKNRIISSLLLAAAITGICIVLPSLVAPVAHTYPLSPMLSSDVRIAAVLRGEQEAFREEMRTMGSKEKDLKHPLMNSLSASSNVELVLPKCYPYYFREWKKNFDSMLMSKAIQIAEFYSGGCMPHPVFCKIVEYFYPKIKSNHDAWKYWRQVSNDIKYYHIIILVIGFGFTLYFEYVRYKNIRPLTNLEKTAALTCSMAVLYALSFSIVTPTAFPRYLAPSLFIIWNAIWFWLADVLFRQVQLNCIKK